jgi:hypothetical protein
VFTDHVRLSEYHEKLEISKNSLSETYDEWLALQE